MVERLIDNCAWVRPDFDLTGFRSPVGWPRVVARREDIMSHRSDRWLVGVSAVTLGALLLYACDQAAQAPNAPSVSGTGADSGRLTTQASGDPVFPVVGPGGFPPGGSGTP